MTIRRHIAPIRFGLGLRLGETPPSDPVAWLDGQLASQTPLPSGATTAEALRARVDTIARRREAGRARAEAMQPSEAGMAMATPEQQGRSPQAEMLRAEMRLWADRRLASPEPFRDRLADFWMNHFTVSRRAGRVGTLPGPLEREAIRPHLTGSFADMLVAVTRHPAMLLYLDNNASIGPNSDIGRRGRRGLNENLAREVLELHTLSPAGGYTQDDVQELARILTGWSVASDREPFSFVWRPEAHEPGPKRLLGRSFPAGEGSQEAALRFLATRPATYRHLAVKLARHFVADDPPPAAVRALEQALRQTEGDLGAVSRALIRLPEAWDPPLGKLRTPKDWVIAAGRATGLERWEIAVTGMAALNQALWSAPQPNGWSDKAVEWAAPEALMRRVDWAYTYAARLGRADLGAVTQAALGPFARAETIGAMRGAGSVRDALTLLFTSPEFLHR